MTSQYLLKPSANKTAGILHTGQPPQPPSASLRLDEEVWAAVAASLGLSGRELEITQGVFRGEAEPAIAAALGISSRTVHTYFERLYHKLGVTSRAELVLRVVREILTLTALPGTSLPPICASFTAGRCPLCC